MGSWLSGPEEDTDGVKARSENSEASEGPVTTRQVFLVQSTWSLLASEREDHGLVFYERLFTENPGLLQLFSFKHVELENIRKDKQVKNQAKKLMAVLGKAVAGLENLPALIPTLKNLGAGHIKYNIRDEDYEPVGEALIYTLDKGLGEKFTDETREAWTVVYGVVADMMKAGAREARQS